jgi:hypothetical protein
MSWPRRIALVVGAISILTLALAAHYYYKGFCSRSKTTVSDEEGRRLEQKAATQKSYLSQHGFNTEVCFLVDMGLPSGRNRFFVYDLRRDSILLTGLVAHGCGAHNFSVDPVFSNADGSSCTSLGRYRIGYKYKGQFGPAYKLYGLDTSNSQAFARNVVLHSYLSVPAHETYPYPICNSRGCPMVSPVFLDALQPVIEGSRRPVCLWIFN